MQDVDHFKNTFEIEKGAGKSQRIILRTGENTQTLKAKSI